MTINDAFQISMALAAFLGGWFMKELFSRIRGLEEADRRLADAISDLRVNLPTHYVTKDDFKVALDAIHQALRRIEDRLNASLDNANSTLG